MCGAGKQHHANDRDRNFHASKISPAAARRTNADPQLQSDCRLRNPLDEVFVMTSKTDSFVKMLRSREGHIAEAEPNRRCFVAVF
jgi:hypothetical protein